MEELKIKNTEIILQNYELNQGKIIISDLDNGSYSFYWGAMNGNIEEFLKKINSSYFADKLSSNRTIFSGKETAKAIRRYIKEDMSIDFPWYKFLPAQKILREEIKSLERCDNENEALCIIESFKDIYSYELEFNEQDEFNKILENVFNSEPWFFLETQPSPEYNFLFNLHKELKKIL